MPSITINLTSEQVEKLANGDSIAVAASAPQAPSSPLAPFDRVRDWEGDLATVTHVHPDGRVDILWDNHTYGNNGVGTRLDPTDRLTKVSS